jgi:hypothetical protein
MIQFSSSEELHIPRSAIAVELAQFYSDFFIHEAKLNNNQFESEIDEKRNLIQSITAETLNSTNSDVYEFEQ